MVLITIHLPATVFYMSREKITLLAITCMSARPIAVSIVGLTVTFLPVQVKGVCLPLSTSQDGMIRRYPCPSETTWSPNSS